MPQTTVTIKLTPREFGTARYALELAKHTVIERRTNGKHKDETKSLMQRQMEIDSLLKEAF